MNRDLLGAFIKANLGSKAGEREGNGLKVGEEALLDVLKHIALLVHGHSAKGRQPTG